MKNLLILLMFIIATMLPFNSVLANGDYGAECPNVNVTCECPKTPCNCKCPTVALAAEPEESGKKLLVSGGVRLGYHAYTANDFLNNLPESDQGAYNAPSGDQPLPPLEGEVNVKIIEYFSVSALLGTYLGKHTNSLGDLSKTQTVYFLAMPRFDWSFDFNLTENTPVTMNPYIGVGVGAAWFAFWHDPSIALFPPLSAIDEQHVVFAYSPSIGFDVPLIYVKPELEDPPFGIDKSKLKLLVDYRYIGAQYKSFNAGGHLFLVGLGMDF